LVYRSHRVSPMLRHPRCASEMVYKQIQACTRTSSWATLCLVKVSKVICFGLVWFGLVGFSLNASLEPQLRAQKRARLAEEALAQNASLGQGRISREFQTRSWGHTCG
jgi:hypothetical protein